MGAVVKLALAVGLEACAHAGAIPARLPAVFTSSGGDGRNCHEICAALASAERLISPTRFHNSVHNAAAGYWGIATGAPRPRTPSAPTMRASRRGCSRRSARWRSSSAACCSSPTTRTIRSRCAACARSPTPSAWPGARSRAQRGARSRAWRLPSAPRAPTARRARARSAAPLDPGGAQPAAARAPGARRSGTRDPRLSRGPAGASR